MLSMKTHAVTYASSMETKTESGVSMSESGVPSMIELGAASMKTKASLHKSLNSNDLAILGLKEVIRNHCLDIQSLGLASMISVRARETAIDGRYWRTAVRSIFPQHPFEVNKGQWCQWALCLFKLGFMT